jgi:hypothetical protein
MKFGILLIALLTVILPDVALAQNSVPLLPVPDGAAMILNVGSADAFGYRIVILPSGKATSIDGAGRAEGQLPADITDRFFRDLAKAMPLTQLPVSLCSQTTTTLLPTFVMFRGQRSTNVSCRSNDKSSALSEDVQAIARTLYVATYRVKAMQLYFAPGGQQVPAVVQPQPATPPPTYSPGGYGRMGYPRFTFK